MKQMSIVVENNIGDGIYLSARVAARWRVDLDEWLDNYVRWMRMKMTTWNTSAIANTTGDAACIARSRGLSRLGRHLQETRISWIGLQEAYLR